MVDCRARNTGAPRLEVDLGKIRHNTRVLAGMLGREGMSLMAVTKVMLGEPAVARVMVAGGARFIGDSRIENIRKMSEAGIGAEFALIRSPMMSQVDEVVRYAHLSFNTEIRVIRALSRACLYHGCTHRVLIMVELGDLREGVLPEKLRDLVAESIQLPGIEFAGIGTNMGCLSGAVPTPEIMVRLSELAGELSGRLGIPCGLVSGGNSTNYAWFRSDAPKGLINNLRMGEMIFLGRNIITGDPVSALCQDAVRLTAEVIECKVKTSAPQGPVTRDAFGDHPRFENRGPMTRVILGLGRQDILPSGLYSSSGMEIIGACSDHLVLDAGGRQMAAGEECRFELSYGALLSAMTSPYVKKVFIPEKEPGGS